MLKSVSLALSQTTKGNHMSTKWQSTLVLALVFALGWILANQTTSNAQSDRPKMHPWQYSVEIGSDINEAQLNARGGKGWELVMLYNSSPHEVRAIYKRPS